LFDALSDRPVAAVAMRWARRWWANHPWRTLLNLSGEVLHEVVAPVARRHPWLLLGGAALAGVALSRLRPWRWVSGGALLTGLLPQVSLASMLDTITRAFESLRPGDDDEPSDPEQAQGQAPEAASEVEPQATVPPVPEQTAGENAPTTVH
jgi:hypothetical protein